MQKEAWGTGNPLSLHISILKGRKRMATRQKGLNEIDYDMIEDYALKAKEDKGAMEKLTEILFPILRFLANYYGKFYPDWDESEIFYVLNRTIEYAVANHVPSKGFFIHYWRFLVKKSVVRASINHNKKKAKDLRTYVLDDGRSAPSIPGFDHSKDIENNIFLQQAMEKGKDLLKIDSLVQALLWSHSFTALEIASICDTSCTAVRRNIQKVLDFITNEAKLNTETVRK